ncbi:transcriptional regulator [Siculibacillus lacustris]|uniref:Transcriptional regulator n=1 Tax=Siculibacillus lacustris TaxID=1549641 RepID=A0A4Q9VEC5_9HYPH|nr:transcriptional regulator [Siculibacillus lacustris]
MITAAQIRASRAALRMAAQHLADHSGVALRTIKRIETFDGIPPSHTSTLSAIKTALERAGIEFIGTPEDRPGIRVNFAKRSEAP